MLKLTPFTKAIVAGVLAAVIIAAQKFDQPWLIVAAAAAQPLAVYFARNHD